ncbi:MAG: hypothetical protein RLZZ58_1408 [Pseudomonadota bacterium]|jgi:2'-5' RNA ligase
MSLHRLFVALRPPRAIRQQLTGIMHGIAGARWQSDDQLHLTLRFIGEVDHHRAEDVAAALGSIHADVITARLSGIGAFERRDAPHMVWAGIDPFAALHALHRKVDQACLRVGIAPDNRAFQPHITVARLNRGCGPIAPFVALNNDLRSVGFTFDAFTLFESELGHGGARYHPVARYALG